MSLGELFHHHHHLHQLHQLQSPPTNQDQQQQSNDHHHHNNNLNHQIKPNLDLGYQQQQQQQFIPHSNQYYSPLSSNSSRSSTQTNSSPNHPNLSSSSQSTSSPPTDLSSSDHQLPQSSSNQSTSIDHLHHHHFHHLSKPAIESKPTSESLWINLSPRSSFDVNFSNHQSIPPQLQSNQQINPLFNHPQSSSSELINNLSTNSLASSVLNTPIDQHFQNVFPHSQNTPPTRLSNSPASINLTHINSHQNNNSGNKINKNHHPTSIWPTPKANNPATATHVSTIHTIPLSTDHHVYRNDSSISEPQPFQPNHSTFHLLSESNLHTPDQIKPKKSLSNSPTSIITNPWNQSSNQPTSPKLQSKNILSASQSQPLPISLNYSNPPPYSSHSQNQYKLADQSSNSNYHASTTSLPVSTSNQLAHHLVQIPETSNVHPGSGTCISSQPIIEESGHNAVEKRYRNNINSHIAALADLVPALQHLRALPSAATSRRHSSQFIVSTSAIGKIPAGLVDGVKAATKLSKGNILSKSVDYVKHLLRTRVEMQEDLNDLKEMIRLRVDGGQILILEWEEKINSKIPERERQRMMEQNEVEDGEDDEEEVGKGLIGNGTKRRKVSDQPDSLGLTKGRGNGKLASINKNQKKNLNHLLPPTLSINSNPHQPSFGGSPLHSDGSNSSNHQSLSVDQSNQIEELNVYKQSQAIPRHSQYTEVYQPTHDFLSQSFINPFQSNLSHLPPSNLLAVSMGLSFAVGSVYHYYQMKSPTPLYTPSNPTTTTTPVTTYGGSCFDDRVHFRSDGIHHRGLMRAGMETVSMASMIFVLLVLFKPEFLSSFIHPSYHVSSASTKIQQRMKKDVVKEEANDQDDYETSIKKVDAQIGAFEFGVECLKGLGHSLVAMGLSRFSSFPSWITSSANEEEQTRQVKMWSKIAEIQTLNGSGQTPFFNRLYTTLKLYNLTDWNMEKEVTEVQRIEEVAKLMTILSLHLRTIFGPRNLISQKLWNRAQTVSTQSKHQKSGLVKDEDLKVDLSHSKHDLRWEVQEVLNLAYEEVSDLLETSKTSYTLLSNQTPSKNLMKRILEIKFEIELIQIWSRIFVSTIKKTSPIPTHQSKLSKGFQIDSIDQLPTRLEEAGDHYALQVSAGRVIVEESIQRICDLLCSDERTKLGQMALLTKGVWSLAFGRDEIAREVGEELVKGLEGNDQEKTGLGSIEGYLELVMKKKKKPIIDDSKKAPLGIQELSTLDRLATLTIKWLSIRRLHLLKNVLPNQTWYSPPSPNSQPVLLIESSSSEIKERCKELKSLMIGLELNQELVDRSTKQSVESILNGESKEYDLVRALKDCGDSIEVIDGFCLMG